MISINIISSKYSHIVYQKYLYLRKKLLNCITNIRPVKKVKHLHLLKILKLIRHIQPFKFSRAVYAKNNNFFNQLSRSFITKLFIVYIFMINKILIVNDFFESNTESIKESF